MADQIEDMTAEMLRRIRTDIDDIEAEIRLRLTGVETELTAVDHHLAALQESAQESGSSLATAHSPRAVGMHTARPDSIPTRQSLRPALLLTERNC